MHLTAFSVSAYKLYPKATIYLIGVADSKLPQPPSQHQSRSEQSILTTIQSEFHVVRNTLLPDLDLFTAAPANQKEHLRLGELLLQSLIRLDNIVVESSWETARKERKEAVKEVQEMLDRLDNAWTARSTSGTT